MTDVVRKLWRRRLKYILCFIITSGLLLEWGAYSALPWLQWPSFSSVSPEAVRILLIADPQLLGFQYTPPSVFGVIVRWDADKYIQKTFALSQSYFQPDVYIFLGDLMDEGEIAKDQEFLQYTKRFLNVFAGADFNRAIFLPGDNDIGGEHGSPFIEHVERFESYFKKNVFLETRFVEFIKVNYLTESPDYSAVPTVQPGKIRIVLSHVPLTTAYNPFVAKVLSNLQPHLILSAHEHSSTYILAEGKTGVHLSMTPSFALEGMQTLNLSDEYMHEIMVPTCSYRMGTQKMGYGALAIEPDGMVSYAVLWLPSRLKQLFCYLVLLAICLIVILLPSSCIQTMLKKSDVLGGTWRIQNMALEYPGDPFQNYDVILLKEKLCNFLGIRWWFFYPCHLQKTSLTGTAKFIVHLFAISVKG